ncbi:hypothetical protein K439DRAFT_1614162 [Ramaria rubella]|nr:hypothetical protein K439DRAFT_1614162 [Ramaria rubella]
MYIQDIVTAAKALTSLSHEPAVTDVVNLILMNLDLSFAIICTLLTTQTSEPSIAAVKKALTDQEDTNLALTGELDDKLSESAMHTKCGNKRLKPKMSGKQKVLSSDTDSNSDDMCLYDGSIRATRMSVIDVVALAIDPHVALPICLKASRTRLSGWLRNGENPNAH